MSPGRTNTSSELAGWRRNVVSEESKAQVYLRLSRAEPDPDRAATLRALSALEQDQADYWAQRLPEGRKPATLSLRFGDRLLLCLARLFGVRAVVPVLAATALRNVESYEAEPDAAVALSSELEVARRAATLAVEPLNQGIAVDVGRDHRRVLAANGSLRAAVFGINDGLVSNLSLIMGVAGAAPPRLFIVLTGLAGLLAGALSMAGGEYISMLSQREFFERRLRVERRHLAVAPAAERAALAQRYEAKGLQSEEAQQLAARLLADPDQALDTIAREHLGLDPEELGSPPSAAVASFVTFALGASIPLLPFFATSGWTAAIWSAALSVAALFLVGSGVSLFTGRHFLLSGARMLAIGVGAAVCTFLIGRLIGVSIAG